MIRYQVVALCEAVTIGCADLKTFDTRETAEAEAEYFRRRGPDWRAEVKEIDATPKLFN
jgi:hypothetical protein